MEEDVVEGGVMKEGVVVKKVVELAFVLCNVVKHPAYTHRHPTKHPARPIP